MYCYKCGRQIESGSICSDCAAQENGYAAPAQQAQPQPQYNAPQYSAPQYSAPQYSAPQYSAPQYSAPQQAAPQQAAPAAPRQYVSYLPEPNNRMYGFGKALTSTILGFIGFIWVYVSVAMAVLAPEAIVALMLLALPFIIVPMIHGISSIKVFTSRKATCAKPIATLILGIVGLSFAAISALIDFVMLCVGVSTF